MVRLILFDIDGTLIRTGGAGLKAFERTFATVFRIPNATKDLEFAGRTDLSLVRECFRTHQIEASQANFEKFCDCYVFWLHHLLGCLNGEICPGVGDFINGLQSLHHVPLLGLLTGNIRLGAEIKLRHYNLWDQFRSGAFGDDHEDRNQLAVIARERGMALLKTTRKLAGKEILVIGDTPADIECGKKIGARVLAVATGRHTCAELRQNRPTWVIEHLEAMRLTELCS
jgi:phosphoglycolate phosphatase